MAISVGFESGNQRVLDLIDKGTRPAQVEQTIVAMNNAGVAVQIMGFTGFPTETRAEAQDSVDFLVDNDLVSVPDGERCAVEPSPIFQRPILGVASYMAPPAFSLSAAH